MSKKIVSHWMISFSQSSEGEEYFAVYKYTDTSQDNHMVNKWFKSYAEAYEWLESKIEL